MSRLLFISTLVVLTSCSQSNTTEKEGVELKSQRVNEADTSSTVNKIEKVNCAGFDFNSAEQRADSILAFMKKAQDSNSSNRIVWEQKFFCSFPNSFKEMQAVFGYDDENGEAPLYDFPKGENVIQYFSQLESIPDSAYYDKYVRINIDGEWKADNIREAFAFANRLNTDTENACKVLSTFSVKEIKSVFRFIFDGPHPKNEHNEKLYKSLKPAIDHQDERLSRILTYSYEKIMAEDDGHGHKEQ